MVIAVGPPSIIYVPPDQREKTKTDNIATNQTTCCKLTLKELEEYNDIFIFLKNIKFSDKKDIYIHQYLSKNPSAGRISQIADMKIRIHMHFKPRGGVLN